MTTFNQQGQTVKHQHNYRSATAGDFKIGTKLYNEFGSWEIVKKYHPGIWEALGTTGLKCIWEGEAKFYTVRENQK